jgi:regulator of sigma E protease
MDIQTVIAIVGMVLVLSFLVIIHELGHFLAARWMKIKVDEFGLGYPPRALTVFKKWGTLFSLNWVPFGGFVRMEGEDGPTPESLPETSTNSKSKSSKVEQVESTDGPFYSKTITQRLIVILAGATVNFVFGILAFSIVFSVLGIPSGAIIKGVNADSPAAAAGLPIDSVIIRATANNQDFDIRGAGQLVAFTQGHYEQEVVLTTIQPCQPVGCKPSERAYTVKLRAAEIAKTQGALGVTPDDYAQFYPWYQMPFRGAVVGVEQAIMLGAAILQALSTMVVDLVRSGVVPAEVTGPVGIVDDARKTGIFSQGPIIILLFMGVISVNLAIMNVLPIPALDGGRAVFLILEKILGKRVVGKVENYANYGGYIILLTLIVLITARDIFRIVTG